MVLPAQVDLDDGGQLPRMGVEGFRSVGRTVHGRDQFRAFSGEPGQRFGRTAKPLV